MKILRAFQYAAYAVLNLGFTLVSYLFFNWWLPFLARPITSSDWLMQSNPANAGCQMLPNWLKWFDTFDATTDEYWIGQYVTNSYTAQNPPPYLLRKWWQVCWLYRNPAYGFCYWVLGVPFIPANWTVKSYTNNNDQTTFDAYSTEGYFNYEASFMSIKVGWKAWNYYTANTGTFNTTPWGPEMIAPLCLTIVPWKNL
jgi:hypothetical protein